MKYSFILIAYNEQENIASCIDSIKRQEGLGDSYEIIVVDDGSKDRTAAIVHGLTKHYQKLKLVGDGKNHGRGYGRYVGTKASSGDYVIMIDADISLPETWLETCLGYIDTYDVVGGIAVPDGDVAYIYRRFKLKPKTIMGSTTITGNNGMYRREVFAKVQFDKNLREGEDVDFNHRLTAAGMSEFCIPGLTVEHQEAKSLLRSMQWLYQSGIGATRQLIQFREIRLPDLAFAATLFTILAALVLTLVASTGLWFVIPLLCLLGTSFMHTSGKFYLPPTRPFNTLGSLLTDALLIACYYIGRLIGPIVFIKNSPSHQDEAVDQ